MMFIYVSRDYDVGMTRLSHVHTICQALLVSTERLYPFLSPLLALTWFDIDRDAFL